MYRLNVCSNSSRIFFSAYPCSLEVRGKSGAPVSKERGTSFQKWSPSIPTWKSLGKSEDFFCTSSFCITKNPKIYILLNSGSPSMNSDGSLFHDWRSSVGNVKFNHQLWLWPQICLGVGQTPRHLQLEKTLYLSQSDSHANVLALAFFLQSCSSSYRQSQTSIPLGLKMGWS